MQCALLRKVRAGDFSARYRLRRGERIASNSQCFQKRRRKKWMQRNAVSKEAKRDAGSFLKCAFDLRRLLWTAERKKKEESLL